MRTDKDPDIAPLEDAARRRLGALAEALDVPAAEFGERPATPVAAGGGRTPHRRRLVLAGLGVATSVAAVAGAAVVLRGDTRPAADTVTAPTNQPECGPQEEAADGTVVAGTLEDGTKWAIRSGESNGWQTTSASVDGEGAGAYGTTDDSHALAINEGVLPLSATVTSRATMVWGMVPAEAVRVEVTAGPEGGRAAITVSACPVLVPAEGDALRTFGVALPPDVVPVTVTGVDAAGRPVAEGDLRDLLAHSAEGGGTEIRVDRQLVSLPLGGVAAPVPRRPRMVVIDGEDGEDGRAAWALAAARDGDELVLATSGPFGYAGGVQGTPEQLLGPDANWTVDRISGGLLVWGPVVPEAERVTLTAADGSTRSVDVLEAVPDMPIGAFAVFVPQDEGLTAAVAERGGEVLQRAVGLDRALTDLAADPGLSGVGVLIERPG